MTVKSFQICVSDDVLNGIVAALNDSPAGFRSIIRMSTGESTLHDHRKRILLWDS